MARAVAVNDVVVASAELGRMIELDLAVGGEELGRQPCDGIICSTPSGSTAYNLSNGGPVLMWGLEAMALTYVAAHSLHARPLVIPPGADVIVWNRTQDVGAAVLVDGHRVSTLGTADRRGRPNRRRALAARDAARGDLRPPVPPELCVLGPGYMPGERRAPHAARRPHPRLAGVRPDCGGRPEPRFQGSTRLAKLPAHPHEDAYERFDARVIVFDRPGYGASKSPAGSRSRRRRGRCGRAPRPSQARHRPRRGRQRRRSRMRSHLLRIPPRPCARSHGGRGHGADRGGGSRGFD